ncbi:DUF5694 domain-containing protein [Psychroserpens sp. AS72]|uniref:DUF5694 domain-containing protein n=1 Tax=Psychroserpens sp. AS72 TaxID=3135775 RepID=UPI00317A38AC
MKNLLYLIGILSIISCNQQIYTQTVETEKTEKIKVYLLGTFHFAQTDSTYNVLDSDKQKSIEYLSEIIAKNNPNKIFTERQPEFEFQNKIDSLYKIYIKMSRPLKTKNEIFQVGFRTAKKLGHEKVYQCDHPGQYGTLNMAVMEYAEKNNQTDILEGKSIGSVMRYESTVNEDSIMNNNTLFKYLQWINSPEVMNTSHSFYNTNFPQIGSNYYYNYDDDDTLIGAELTADWYRRNIMIYSKIINQLDYNESAIFLLIGADHVPIIKNLFKGNPYFEVVETSKWLK